MKYTYSTFPQLVKCKCGRMKLDTVLTYALGAERRDFISFRWSKWQDMSVAKTMSITSPLTRVKSSELSRCKMLVSSYIYSWRPLNGGEMLSQSIAQVLLTYIHQQSEGIRQVMVFQNRPVVVQQG